MNIFCINGAAGVGKDTFCNMVEKYQKTEIVSTVDFCKQILRGAGWNGVAKEAKERIALKKLKECLSEYNDAPFKYTISSTQYARGKGVQCLFIMVREYVDMIRYQQTLKAKSILVTNPRIPIVGIENEFIDRFPPYYSYDYVIENHGGLSDLEALVRHFIAKINVVAKVPAP